MSTTSSFASFVYSAYAASNLPSFTLSSISSADLAQAFDSTKVQAWVHDLSPFLLQFSSHLGIRWYGLAYLMGFFAGAAIMIFMVRRGRQTLPELKVIDFITYCVVGTMLGGRLGYAFFYSPDLLVRWDSSLPINLFGQHWTIWNLLAVWEGGMASHGGIMGLMLASWLFARRHKMDWLHLGDLTTLGGGIGIVCGRIANFINGELVGRPVESAISWAVKFPQDMLQWLYSHNAADQENLKALGQQAMSFVGIYPEAWNQWLQQASYDASARYKIQQSIEQLILNLQSGQHEIAGALQPLLQARHPSQIYQAIMEGLLVFLICFFAWHRPRKPGFIGALFLTSYAVMRIIGEQFRMPDAHIGFQIFGLTRGQILSLLQLTASAVFLYWISRRPVEVISGWGQEAQDLKAREP